MAKKITISEEGEIFKVKGDGTIERIGNAALQPSAFSALDKEILDIIKVNSYSKKLLAAYKARKIANRICKAKYGKPNYKEYVEMLMVKHFPKELEKARFIGKSTLLFLLIIPPPIILAIICGHGYFGSELGVPVLIFAVIAISWIFAIWKWIIPKYKETFNM
jgi:hypothetical protein